MQLKFPDKNIPRWIIFAYDILVSLFALFIAYALRFDFFNSKLDFEEEYEILKTSLPIFILVRVFTFYFGKTYAGIIRYTSTEDNKRILKTVFLGTLIIIFCSIIRYYFYDKSYLLPRPIIAIEFFLTLGFMIVSRVAVKLVYHEGRKDKENSRNILIYGAGEMGIITLRTFSNSTKIKYNIIGFLDDDKSKEGKLLQGIKISHTSKFESILAKNHIDSIIVSMAHPSGENESKVVDIALNNSVSIMNVPPIEDWMNGELNVNQIKKVRIEDLLGRKEIELNKTKISAELNDSVVLITGAAGSIGSEIVRQVLHFSPAKIVLLDQAESSLYDLEQELILFSDVIEIVVGDISNLSRIERVFSYFKPDFVFHAAAYKHVPLMENNPCEAIETNVQGTRNLVNLSDNYNVKKFVMISTDKAVNPTNVMGASKRIAEIITQSKNKNSKTNYITTRFGNVLGSNGSVIPLFKKQIEKGGPVTVTHQDVTRFFMTIPEACQLVLEAGSMGKGGEIFVFDMGESVKIIDLAKRMIKLSGFEPGVDIEIKITGLRPGEKLYEELLSNKETTLATHHSQILIGKVREIGEEVSQEISELISFANNQENEEVVKKMKKIIPEFVSNNSVFDKFDKN